MAANCVPTARMVRAIAGYIVPVREVGAVELVDDARQAGELRAQHVGEGVDGREGSCPEARSPELSPVGYQPKVMPCTLRAADRLADPEILAHVVEDELLAAGRLRTASVRVLMYADRALQSSG